MQEAIKGVLICCKLEIFLNIKPSFPILSDLNTLYPKILYLELFINLSVVSGHLDIRSGEHKGVSPLARKKVKPIKNSAVHNPRLHCNYLPSFDNFRILAHENNKVLLKIKESLLRMRDKPSLNRNISSAPLRLFDKVSSIFLVYFTVAYLTLLVYFLLNIIVNI